MSQEINMSTDQNKENIIDGRIVGIVIIIIALIIIGISMFFRISDGLKSKDYAHVDGNVSFIDTYKTRVGRKVSSNRVISVRYTPEGSDLEYVVDGPDGSIKSAKIGDTFRVYYKENNPNNAYIAEKDWLTRRYIHKGKNYSIPLVIGAVVFFIGYAFLSDGIKANKMKKQKAQ